MFITDRIGQLFSIARSQEAAAAPSSEAPEAAPREESASPLLRSFQGLSDFTAADRTQSVYSAQATEKQRTPQESQALADEHYKGLKDAFAKTPAHAPGMAMGFLTAFSSEPAYQAQLIKRLEADGHLVKLATVGNSQKEIKENRKVLVQALGQARIAKSITDDQIRKVGASGSSQVWREIGQAMVPPVVGISLSPGATRDLQKVEAAVTKLENANEKVGALEQQLATELIQLGPGLTDEQRQRYSSAFYEVHKTHFDARATAEQELATALQAKGLDDAALCDPDFAAPLMKAHELLAKTPHAQVALDWSAKLVAEAGKSPLLTRRLEEGLDASYGRIVHLIKQNVITPAFQNMAAKALQENNGDAAKALDGLFAASEQLKSVKDLKDSYTQIQDLKPFLAKVKRGDTNALKELAKSYDGMTGVGRGMAAGIYGLGVLIAVEKGKAGEYDAMVKELAGSSKGFLELSAGAMESLSAAGRLSKYQVGAKKAASFIAEKLAPGLGALAAGASAYAHWNQYKKEANPLLLTAIVGDALGVLGEAASVFPPLYVPGKIVSAAGTIISAASDLASTFFKAVENHQNQLKVLERAGISKDVAESLVLADLKDLSERGGLSPQQVQEFLKGRRGFAAQGPLVDAMLDTSKLLGLSGAKLVELADRMTVEGERDLESVARQLKSIVEYGGGDKELLQFLQNAYPETYAWAKKQG